MATTANDIFKKAMALIDEINTSTGNPETAATTDYEKKSIILIDSIQKELLKNSDLYTNYEVSRAPIQNLLGSQFDIREYTGTADLTIEGVNPSGMVAKTYYFEVDGAGTVYIEDYTSTWNTLATVSVTSSEGFTAYKGAVTGTAGATKSRIRFSGSYYYRTINRSIFYYPFSNGNEPTYMPWYKIALPTGCKSVDDVIIEDGKGNYLIDSDYKIEWSGTIQELFVPWDFSGKVRVQYKPVPTTITALANTLQIDDITAISMPYYLASLLMAAEQNEYLSNLFMSLFQSLKAENSKKQASSQSQIVDCYGTSF